MLNSLSHNDDDYLNKINFLTQEKLYQLNVGETNTFEIFEQANL